MELAIFESDIFGDGVEELGEGFFVASESFGDDDGGVVSGGDDDSAEQVFDADIFSDFDEHF